MIQPNPTPWADPNHDVMADVRWYVERFTDEQWRASRSEEEALMWAAVHVQHPAYLDRLHFVAGSWPGPVSSVASALVPSW